MSDSPQPKLAAAGFPSLESLRAAHSEWLKRSREGGLTGEVVAAVGEFLAQARATGKFLDSDSDRWTAQSMVDYWTTLIARTGGPELDNNLDDFDPTLAPVLEDSQCPYRGLNPFRENDSATFFGRAGLVDELLERARRDRLVFVVGASGSGKSSLVLAGLLPALRAGRIPGSEKWHYCPPVTPGSNPLAGLDAATRDIPAGTAAVLVVDQFEELFTLCPDDAARAAFTARLLSLARDAGSECRVFLTLRADFEEQIALVPDLAPWYAQALRVRPLSAQELREAIEKPAALVGLRFEEGIVDDLTKEVLGQPAGLPLLQFALLKLWDGRERNRITWTNLRKLGNARKALANAADAFYDSLIPEDQEECRRILLRLVRPGEGLEVTSNRLRRMDLRGLGAVDRTERVLGRLVSESLLRLTPGGTRDQDMVEVAHEALVRNWPKLEKWIAEERVALRGRLRVTAAAELWASHAKDPGGLLGGSLLEEAARYTDLNPLEAEFVAASRNAVEVEQRRVEEERARELAQARALAAAQAKAGRRLRLLVAALLTGLVVTVPLVIYAWGKRQEADHQEHLATARLLAFESEKQQDRVGAEELAALLAAQGYLLNRNYQGDASSEIDPPLRAILSRPYFVKNLYPGTGADHAGAMALSPDAGTLALARDHSVVLWRRNDAKPVLASFEQPIRAVAFTPAGDAVAAGADDGSVWLWANPANPKQLAGPGAGTGQAGAAVGLVFSSDGKELGVLTESSDILLLNLDGRPGQRLRGHTSKVTALAFSRDGARMASGGADGAVRLWSRTGRPGAEWMAAPRALWNATAGYNVSALAISPDGSALAIATSGGQVQVAVLRERPAVPVTSDVGAEISCLDFDGERLAVGTVEGRIWLERVDNLGSQVVLAGHDKAVLFVRLAGQGRFYSGSADLPLRSWAKLPEEPARSDPPKKGLEAAAFSDDGGTLAAGGDASDATIAIQPAGKDAYELKGSESGVTALAFGPGGGLLAAGGWDKTVRVWTLNGAAKDAPDLTATGHQDAISAIAVAAGGRRIASAAFDHTLRLWEVTGSGATAALSPFRKWDGDYEALAFSGDGKYLAAGGEKGAVCVWTLAGGAPPQCVTAAAGAATVTAVAFSRGTKTLLAAGDAAGAIVVRDPERLGDNGAAHLLAESKVTALAFSPDGTALASGLYSGLIQLWDMARPASAPVALSGHAKRVSAVGFPAGGRQLVSVAGDGVLQWTLPAALKDRVCEAAGRTLTDDEWKQFLSQHPLTEERVCR